MNEVDRVIHLLESDSIEKRIAAAIVLGELRVRKAQDGLLALLGSEVPVLQRHAIEALTKIGIPKKLVPRLFGFLTLHVADVREAARAAIASFGEEIVPSIRERIPHAPPDERHALETILAELGGKDAFSTLLNGLASSEAEASKQAAIGMRQHVKSAGARERRSYLAETEKFLATQSKAGAPPSVIAAAIKIMGYLEDEKSTSTLLEYASDAAQPPLVRQEALIALRFALGKDRGADEKKVVAALLDAAEADDRTLAHTALHTLGSMALPSGMAKRVEKLSVHPDFERARFVLEMLGRQTGRGGDAGARPRHVLARAQARRDRRHRARRARRRGGAAGEGAARDEGRRPRVAPEERAPPVGEEDPERAPQAAPRSRRSIAWATGSADGRRSSTWSATPTPRVSPLPLRALAQKLRKAKNDDKAAAVLRAALPQPIAPPTTTATPSPPSSSRAARRTPAPRRATPTSR